jgi:hypothetical protein
LKNDANVNVSSKSKKHKKTEKKNIFVVLLKVTDEKGKIRIRRSEERINGSGSTPKCQG